MCSRQQCKKCYLVSLNSLLILSGLAFIVLSVFLAVQYKGYSQVIGATFIWTPLGVGLGLVLTGLLGCCGAIFDNKVSLCLYTFFCTLLLLLVLATGTLLLVAVRDLVKVGEVSNSADLSGDSLNEINTFESVLFNKCCYSNIHGWGSYLVGPCPCTHSTNNGCTCYQNAVRYQYEYETFDQQICDMFSEIETLYDGRPVPIVGSPDKGGCGGGDPKVLQKVIGTYASTSIAPGAWIEIIMAVVLLGGLVIACIIMCQRAPEEKGYQPTEDDRLTRDTDLEDNSGVELTESLTSTPTQTMTFQ